MGAGTGPGLILTAMWHPVVGDYYAAQQQLLGGSIQTLTHGRGHTLHFSRRGLHIGRAAPRISSAFKAMANCVASAGTENFRPSGAQSVHAGAPVIETAWSKKDFARWPRPAYLVGRGRSGPPSRMAKRGADGGMAPQNTGCKARSTLAAPRSPDRALIDADMVLETGNRCRAGTINGGHSALPDGPDHSVCCGGCKAALEIVALTE